MIQDHSINQSPFSMIYKNLVCWNAESSQGVLFNFHIKTIMTYSSIFGNSNSPAFWTRLQAATVSSFALWLIFHKFLHKGGLVVLHFREHLVDIGLWVTLMYDLALKAQLFENV